MQELIISKDSNNIYIKTASNNEKLNIIADILLDKKLREYFYNQLNNIDLVLSDNKFNIKSSDDLIEFEFYQNKVNPNLTNSEYSNNVIINVKIPKKQNIDKISNFSAFAKNNKLVNNIYNQDKIEIENVDELTNYYQTDIPKQVLLDLIIKFEELIYMDKNPIILRMHQDNFSLI